MHTYGIQPNAALTPYQGLTIRSPDRPDVITIGVKSNNELNL